MKAKMWNLVSSFTFALLCFVLNQAIAETQMPDHQIHRGKLFYYKIPLNETEQQNVQSISIAEVNSGRKLPSWLLFFPSKYELVGVPLIQSKEQIFFHKRIIFKNNTSDDDVFMIEVLDAAPQHPPSNPSRQCQIKVNYTFDSAEDVWKLAEYVMPNYVRSSDSELRTWALNEFSFAQAPNEETLKYVVTFTSQPCEHDPESEDVQFKLRKLGTKFDVIKSTFTPNKSQPLRDEEDLLLNMISKNQRFARRHQINRTPALLPDYMSMTASIVDPSDLLSSEEPAELSRIMPSLSSPYASLQTVHVNVLGETPLPYEPLTTPLLPSNKWRNQIYSTPSILPEVPSHYFSNAVNLITPTPTITFIISDTSSSFLDKMERQESPTAYPASTVMPSESTTTFSPEMISSRLPEENTGITESQETTTTGSTQESTTASSITSTTKSIIPNKPPVIRERIPKLRLTSGVYWSYKIPEDSFSDFEDGNTRNLKLAFSFIDDIDVPAADYFIQFDSENQILYALPTEDHIGRHKFQLMAVDSQGQWVSDQLEISVVQHKLSRSFTHKFSLEQISWNSMKYKSLVDAVYNLIKNIALLFNDNNINSIFVQKMEQLQLPSSYSPNSILGADEPRFWRISWTNSSLKTYPCPSTEIMSIFNKLSEKKNVHEMQSVLPSLTLRKLLEHNYSIKEVKYQLSTTCSQGLSPDSGLKAKGPQLRNPIKNMTFMLGQAFNYSIPSDTFMSPKGGDSRDLVLELLTPFGHIVNDREDCVGFNSTSQIIFALTLNEECIGENSDYRLIASDPLSGSSAWDTFVVDINPDANRNLYTFELTLQLIPIENVDMDLQAKILIAQRVAVNLLSRTLSDIKVLRIRKQSYRLTYKNNYDYRKSTDDITSNEIRARRDTASMNTYRSFYEFVLSVDSLASDSACPSKEIQEEIILKIFSSTDEPKALATISALFQPDYELVYLGFKAIGKCKNYLSPKFIGNKLNTNRGIDTKILPSTVVPMGTQQPATTKEDEIWFGTLVPAILTIGMLFIISCLIIVILVKYRRSQDKNRFEVTPSLHGVGETESFLQKGRVPVIFESDINPNAHLINHQAYMASQMTQMKHLNRNPYQPVPIQLSDRQRANPPPYI